MKREEKELVCKWLDRFTNYYKINSIEKDIDKALAHFKKDNNLLPNVSGWYLHDVSPNWIGYRDFENQISYGINGNGRWFKVNAAGKIDNQYLATQEQVERRLIPFFEKMYPKGTKVNYLDGFVRKVNGTFCISNGKNISAHNLDSIHVGNIIMKDGILAEIIEESEVDMLKAEIRKLSDKLKELGA